MKLKRQAIRDQDRETYLVTFPTDLDADRVLAWLGSISGTLPKRSKPLAKDTVVFETWATSEGLTHRLKVPKGHAEYIASQLRTHGRGITVTKDETRPDVDWTSGASVGMSSPARQLRIAKHSDLSASVLGSVQALQGDEMVLIQWVVAPAPFERPPANSGYTRSNDFSIRRSLLNGPPEASSDEVSDRRKKLEQQNLLGIGRIMAKATTERRANDLVMRVESALGAANSAANYFKTRRGKNLTTEANLAASPLLFPAQFSLSELAGVISWPIGTPFVAGLPKGSSRTLFATGDVATEGRPLGSSNFEGHERPIALPYDLATHHMVVVGSSGTGKTVGLANGAVHDIKEGYGVFVVDAGDSRSDETLFSRVVNTIPPGHEDRVIVIDVMEDRMNPVGFNILEQGNPRSVADRIMRIFTNLFPDVSSGVWTPQLLFHGIYTLAEHGGLSFPDIIPLLNPKTAEEQAWSDEVTANVKDRDVREWWQRWKSFDKSERDRNIQPLYNRIWNIVNRAEVRNIIGQSTSTFSIREALEQNKVVLINLAGADEVTAKILGSIFVDSIWNVARQMQPSKANFLYLDEFQVMTSSLSVPLDDLLSRARKHNLGLAMATQHFADRVPREVKSAAINNARTQIVFRVANDEARTWNAEFDKHIDVEDFKMLNNYEALAKVASGTGQTAVSLRTYAPVKSTGTAQRVIQLSRAKYGRPIAEVEAERDTRRIAVEKRAGKRPSIGEREWKP